MVEGGTQLDPALEPKKIPSKKFDFKLKIKIEGDSAGAFSRGTEQCAEVLELMSNCWDQLQEAFK